MEWIKAFLVGMDLSNMAQIFVISKNKIEVIFCIARPPLIFSVILKTTWLLIYKSPLQNKFSFFKAH
jgi:hypothetical protein